MDTLIQFLAGSLWVGLFVTVIAAGAHNAIKEKR
jgi:hypothetical protein